MKRSRPLNVRCGFRLAHDENETPVGPRCTRTATREIVWRDGRVSATCLEHGLSALTPEARKLVACVRELVITITTVDEWIDYWGREPPPDIRALLEQGQWKPEVSRLCITCGHPYLEHELVKRVRRILTCPKKGPKP